MTIRAAAPAPPFEPAAPPPPPLPPRSPDSGEGGHREVRARGAARPAPVAPAASADPLTFAGLGACVDEARRAALSAATPPEVPTSFAELRARVARASPRLPPGERAAVGEPLLATLDRLGPRGLARLLAQDPAREGAARLLLDAAGAVLQRAEGYAPRATAALQEVVSDLYDGFLSAEDRRGVKPPDHGVAPPLVRWGDGETGPSTWPATAAEQVGLGAAVVSLPAANARAGLLAWPALAHETAGHDVLAADDGLREELAMAVRREVGAARLGPALAAYWADRIDETAADVMGVLNMGPAAAAGLVGYFRALNGALGGAPALRNVGRAEDPHPADVARAYLAAETVRLLAFGGAKAWADRLTAEADRDLGRVRLAGVEVDAAAVRASAAAVARAIVRTPVAALEGRALGDIQGWSDRDEAVVARLRGALASPRGPAAAAGRWAEGAYAAHAVAAGVYEALSGAERPEQAMKGMVDLLAAMAAKGRASAGRREGIAPGAQVTVAAAPPSMERMAPVT